MVAWEKVQKAFARATGTTTSALNIKTRVARLLSELDAYDELADKEDTESNVPVLEIIRPYRDAVVGARLGRPWPLQITGSMEVELEEDEEEKDPRTLKRPRPSQEEEVEEEKEASPPPPKVRRLALEMEETLTASPPLPTSLPVPHLAQMRPLLTAVAQSTQEALALLRRLELQQTPTEASPDVT